MGGGNPAWWILFIGMEIFFSIYYNNPDAACSFTKERNLFNMKQKELSRKSAIILFLTAAFIGCIVTAKTAHATGNPALTGIQGVWITFFDYKSAGLYDKSENIFSANADTYFQKLKKDGINTVYFHVVPCNDAIYPSQYLSWSSYMFQSEPDYDPLGDFG